MSDVLLTNVEGGIARLTLNRPQSLNALSRELFLTLIGAFEELERNIDVSVIVLTGAGRAFCAGGEVSEMPAGSKALTFEERVADLRRRAELTKRVADSSKVTIAMINGVAVGVGLAVALACDFRLAARSAKLITGFVKMGLSGDCGAIHLMTNLIGETKAKELFFLSDPLTADRAEAIGAITRCVDDEALAHEVDVLARRLASGPTVAHRYMKANFAKAREPLATAIADEAVFLVRSAITEDHSEAKKAFEEKRTPVFRGR